MAPIYRFLLYTNSWDSEPRVVTPVYGDGMTLDYDTENNEQFYRAKLSGKLVFIGADYEYIAGLDLETEFFVLLQKSDAPRPVADWQPYWRGTFAMTNCEISDDDQTVTVQPDVLDGYNEVLDGIEKEFNVVQLGPESMPLTLTKKPILQAYLLGSEKLTSYMGGIWWDQEVNDGAYTDTEAKQFNLVKSETFMELQIDSFEGAPAEIAGTYIGSYRYTADDVATLNQVPNNGYQIKIYYTGEGAGVDEDSRLHLSIYRNGNTTPVYDYSMIDRSGDGFVAGKSVRVNGFSGNPGFVVVSPWYYDIYNRIMLDVDTFQNTATSRRPENDIVSENPNYRYVTGGTSLGIFYISTLKTDTPNEYGNTPDGRYYVKPNIGGYEMHPIAPLSWRYSSLWVAITPEIEALLEQGNKDYILRDTYKVSSIISSFLREIAPGVKHEATEEYSQFFYADRNPITNEPRRYLLATQKTNVIRGEYSDPAQKAMSTLRQFMNMLRDCFGCYWHIEDGKFRIEHISWYLNGGKYGGGERIPALDLTERKNARNGRPWDFCTSKYSFDKLDMPQRYQYKWMDEVTTLFSGTPLEVISKYVQKDKTEDVTIAGFSSDINLALIDPSKFSSDGFMLFDAEKERLSQLVVAEVLPQTASATAVQSAANAPIRLTLLADAIGNKISVLVDKVYSGATGQWSMRAYDSSGASVGTTFTFNLISNTEIGELQIPTDAVELRIWCSDYASIQTGSFASIVVRSVTAQGVQLREFAKLPSVDLTMNGKTTPAQNGYLSMVYLQPKFLLYDMPARNLVVNGESMQAAGISLKKKQDITFPVGNDDPDPDGLIKNSLGFGKIEKMSINLSSRSAKTTLKYEQE